jgi:maltose alpha-D-glucosyltransferase/alpha-amylase
LRTLLDAYLLEKAIYEVSYELTYRPPWVRIPLTGILDVVASLSSARISTERAGTGSPM